MDYGEWVLFAYSKNSAKSALAQHSAFALGEVQLVDLDEIEATHIWPLGHFHWVQRGNLCNDDLLSHSESYTTWHVHLYLFDVLLLVDHTTINQELNKELIQVMPSPKYLPQ